MELSLRPVTMANREDLELIEPGRRAAGWVHVGWWWHQASIDRTDVEFRLVHLAEEPAAVGMVAWGRAYADEALLRPVPGRYELAHLVIDHRHHRCGIGRATAQAVLPLLAAAPDCREVVVAHHPDNEPSRALFTGLGLHPTDERNHDGDPLLRATPAEVLGRARAADPTPADALPDVPPC